MTAQPAILEDYIARYSRWGRWGPDDQLGAMNLVGPEQVRAAAALVRDGQVISLTMPYDQTGPQRGGLRSNPRLITTATGTDVLAGAQDRLGLGSLGFADDMVIMGTQTGTQWDALSHIFHKGRMWNGYSAAEHTSAGAGRNGIQHWSDRLVMRAVLVDLPVLRGIPALDDGYAITAGDLEEALAATGVSVQPGDALVVRTGQMAARRGQWGDYAGGAAPGLSLYTVPWLFEKNIAAVATDTYGVEVSPNEIDEFQPLHQVAIVHMGLAFGEIFDLDALSAACAADGRYEFMLAATPLKITGAAGLHRSGRWPSGNRPAHTRTAPSVTYDEACWTRPARLAAYLGWLTDRGQLRRTGRPQAQAILPQRALCRARAEGFPSLTGRSCRRPVRSLRDGTRRVWLSAVKAGMAGHPASLLSEVPGV